MIFVFTKISGRLVIVILGVHFIEQTDHVMVRVRFRRKTQANKANIIIQDGRQY